MDRKTVRRAALAAVWIGAILLIPAGFSLFDDRPLTWMNWRGYFWFFGLPYGLAVLYLVFTGRAGLGEADAASPRE